MRHARGRAVRRATRLTAVAGLLLGTAMIAQGAMAGEAAPRGPAESPAVRAAATGADLVDRLGTARTAGSWIGADGRAVVAVTDAKAADAVRRAGAEAKTVRHSMDELRSAAAALRAAPRVPGTAWVTDYRTNRVTVEADGGVSAADWTRMSRVAHGIGAFVRMQRTPGRFTTRLNGAQPILSTGGRCSAGFNVTDGRTDFILTAGHCGPTGSIWFAEGQGGGRLGRTAGSSFPGHDFSLVRYDSGRAGQGADVVAIGGGNGVRITGAGEAAVGQRVFRSGSTSGLHEGEVTGLNATVNYPEGTVTGLIQTTVCAEPGDSGGPLFSEGIALGVTSGGSGDCTTGGTTFFQPAPEALTALGVKLIVTTPRRGAAQGAAPTGGSSGAPAGGAGTPAGASPGASAAVTGATTARTLLARLSNPANIGPGLLVIGGSLIALVATRWIRTEQDRRAFRRHHASMWG
ncbi:S1 family peptidase [Streptomyces sp. NPDC046985]|uniref:S1 family peptidase n=1 Tax=Streptomyces sp. NPDC046985 TaxID=3155377 RepID=UPI0033F2B34C